ncbi:MAG: ABC transporter substrate-binding protein [Rhodospirillales bacterium]|nr:ABC transporter substrate-binding protein [Rhodospirillales bacterium]
MKRTFRGAALAVACMFGLASAGHAADAIRGVTDTEIIIGTYTDLSGVTATWGINNANAWRMAFEEQNAKGGIHGRKIRYIVEDSQYQVPRSIQAANKLINRDNVFMMVGNGGTPMNNAVMPDQLAKGVPNVFPLTAARSMYEPFHKLKFGQFASYYDQIRAGLKLFLETKGIQAPCAMYQDTDFGRDVMDGVRDQLAAMNRKLVADTAHKPTDTDFGASIAKLRDARCDMLVLATIVRDTNQIVAAVNKAGWKVPMLGQSAIYDSAVAEVPGGANDGLYAMTPALFAYPDDPRPAVRAFATTYKAKFGRDPNFAAEVGYGAAGAVILGLQNAGRDLTVDRFVKGMEQINGYVDVFGSPSMTFSDTSHHGSTQSFLVQVRDGRWTQVTPEPIGYGG